MRAHGAQVAKLLSEPDRGIHDAMNKGLAMATGDFMGFLNANDMLASSGRRRFDRMRQGSARHRRRLRRLGVYVCTDRRDACRASGAAVASRLTPRYGLMPSDPLFYVRRSLLSELGPFDARLRIAADYHFILRCLGRWGNAGRLRARRPVKRSLHAMLSKGPPGPDRAEEERRWRPDHAVCKNLRKLPQFFASR